MGSGAMGGAMSGATSGAAMGTSIMPGWGTAIGAAAGAIYGGITGSKADKKRKKAEAERKRLMQQDLANRQKLFEQEQEMRKPVLAMIPEAMSEEPLDYAQTSANIRENYARQLRELTDSNMGLGVGGYRSARLRMPQDLAAAYQQGKAAKRALRFQIGSMANPLQAGMNVSGGYANLAGLEAERAADAQREQEEMMGSLSQAGQNLGMVLGGGGSMGGFNAGMTGAKATQTAMGGYKTPAPTQTVGNVGPYGALPKYGGQSAWNYYGQSGNFPAPGNFVPYGYGRR